MINPGADVGHRVRMFNEPISVRLGAGNADGVYALPPRYHSFVGVSQLVIKRWMDVMGAGVGLVVFAPLFGVIALLILLDSGLPVLFQWKLWKGGKFSRAIVQKRWCRMRRHGRRSQHERHGSACFKMRCDPRVTAAVRCFALHLDTAALWIVLRGI